MRSSITKITVAAAILIAVLIGISQLGGSSGSVAWGEVARKVEASRGLIYRSQGTITGINGPEYSVTYLSGPKRRADGYQDGQIMRSTYRDYETGMDVMVFHTDKRYIRGNSSHPKAAETQRNLVDPKYLVQTILSCKHEELGRRIIEGVLCEGLETTDPAFFGPLPATDHLIDAHLRLWVNAETKYPVQFEAKVKAEMEGQALSSQYVLNQFQWDVAIDPGVFEPNIPAGYEQM